MLPKKIQNRPLIIRSQYGDESIALVQWAYEAGLQNLVQNVEVVTIDTGFAASSWAERVKQGEQHAKDCGFKTRNLISPISFADAVKGRGEFPSVEFQWCSALLKGLPFLDWLDTWDPNCQAIILMAKRKSAALAHLNLTEWIENCEYHNNRTLWHPLINLETQERDALLDRAKFTPLHHRSLECDPCVHSTKADLARLNKQDIQKVKMLEEAIQSPILQLIHQAKKEDVNSVVEETYLDLFYRGCGNHFGCGL